MRRGKCRQEDGEYDSDHRVLISGNVAPEAGSTKTDGSMVSRFYCEPSHATRNPFTRWLSGCNATNLGLMKSAGADHQRGGLTAISKRISERGRCAARWIWFNWAQPTGDFKRTLYLITSSIHRALYTGGVVLWLCISSINTSFKKELPVHHINRL